MRRMSPILTRRGLYAADTWAVRALTSARRSDVSACLARTVGKSTLMLLNGTLRPNEGELHCSRRSTFLAAACNGCGSGSASCCRIDDQPFGATWNRTSRSAR